MGNKQDAAPIIVTTTAQDLHHLSPRLLGQVARGLIAQKQRLLAHQCASDRGALHLATGKLMGQGVEASGESQAFGQSCHPCTSCVGHAVPSDGQRQRDVLLYAQVGHQVEELKHIAHLLASLQRAPPF